jgi:peptidoglycan/xylan/chitin deacetylase (PgdA/CDA1 family)
MSSDYFKEQASPDSDEGTIRNVLVLHKLTDCVTFGSTNYSPRRITKLLEQLSGAGYQFVSVNDIMSSYDKKRIAVTFDDGYAHLATVLPPLIDRFKIKPTIFLPTSYIGKSNNWDYSSFFKSEPHLSRQQIEYLSEIGVDFGTHGHRHIELTSLDENLLDSELFQSKQILEEIVKKPVETMSFPFGKTSSEVLVAAKRAGYKISFTMAFPDAADSKLTLGRIPIYFFDSPESITQKLERTGFYPFHKAICRSATALSVGTILFNKFLGRS